MIKKLKLKALLRENYSLEVDSANGNNEFEIWQMVTNMGRVI